MADPRLNVKFEEIEAVYATFKIDNSFITFDATKGGGSAGVGFAVTLSAVNTVTLTIADSTVLGKLIMVTADNMCTVQIWGGMSLPKGTNAVTVNKRISGDLGPASAKGYIKSVADAATPSAAEVNNLAYSRGLIIDGTTDTANVQVLLM